MFFNIFLVFYIFIALFVAYKADVIYEKYVVPECPKSQQTESTRFIWIWITRLSMIALAVVIIYYLVTWTI